MIESEQDRLIRLTKERGDLQVLFVVSTLSTRTCTTLLCSAMCPTVYHCPVNKSFYDCGYITNQRAERISPCSKPECGYSARTSTTRITSATLLASVSGNINCVTPHNHHLPNCCR